MSVGANASNVICRNNHVNVASGAAYVAAGTGSRGNTIEGASGTTTATGTWEGIAGEWTAGLVCGTSGTITVGQNTGRYVKRGNVVTATVYLDSITVSSPTGTLTLTGLPFASGSSTENRSAVALHGNGLGSSCTGLSAQLAQNQTGFPINTRFASGDWTSNASDIEAGSVLVVSVTYIVD